MRSSTIEAITVTAELCGRVFTEAAARVFASDLEGFDEAQVMAALKRCRAEVRGVLTVQDVVSRLDDGRPGPDEAFALLPLSEGETTVWTDEIAKASGVALSLLDIGDKAGARLAFREKYAALVREAREARRPARWWPSLGHDAQGREAPIRRAVDAGRLTAEHARELLPGPGEPDVRDMALGRIKQAALGALKVVRHG